ncbi:class I SAM-dependent methyltransferase [Pseudomonadota bacterium]
MLKNLMPLFILALAASSTVSAGGADADHLASVLAAEAEDVQARYVYRHPQETLEYFGIAPGMTVVEALPGGGWYTKILLPYIGQEGRLIGADYSGDMYPLFGFFSEEQLEAKKTFVTDFPAKAADWAGEDSTPVSAFVFGAMPEEMKGQADAVLFIRALHNLARFEGEGGFLTAALQNAFDVLKPGGTAGVVQHQARDDMPDDWANGSKGYLKKDFVIAKMEAAGFEFVSSSDINQNEKDQPTDSDIVWRLPPSLATSRKDPELKAELTAIGESNRMTLKFRKPE